MSSLPLQRTRRANLGMTFALGAAIVTAGALAFAGTRSIQAPVPRAEEPLPPQMAAAEADPAQGNSQLLDGEVLETLAVSKYTYLRLRTSAGEIWAAVPSASIAVGSHVAVAGATRMDDFKSSTLKRTFKTIYFGTLATGAGAAAPPASKFSAADVLSLDDDGQELPPGHPDIGAAAAPSAALSPVNDSDPLPPGHPDIAAGDPAAPFGTERGMMPGAQPSTGDPAAAHAGMNPAPSDEPALPVVRVARARGKNGHLIGELQANRQALAGQVVRVRGQVTKVTPHVQGHTFLHLRDGNQPSGAPVLDLAVSSNAEVTRGQMVTFEGVLRADVDLGIGYRYPLLLENAVLLGE